MEAFDAWVVMDRRGKLTHRTGTGGIYLGKKSAEHFAEGCNKVGMFAPYRVQPVNVTPKERE